MSTIKITFSGGYGDYTDRHSDSVCIDLQRIFGGSVEHDSENKVFCVTNEKTDEHNLAIARENYADEAVEIGGNGVTVSPVKPFTASL